MRPFVVPPGTPKERVDILRKGFTDALKDPELVAEDKKANLELNPLKGAELERRVKEILNLDPSLTDKLKQDPEIARAQTAFTLACPRLAVSRPSPTRDTG